jgi:hypothetical protein
MNCYWNGSPANPASLHVNSWGECCAQCAETQRCTKWVFRGAQPSGNNCMLHAINATAKPAGSQSGVVCGELAQ